MKRLIDENGDMLYVGTAREISRVYRGLNRTEFATPSHCDVPKFNFGKMYGLRIDFTDYYNPVMWVLSADTVCWEIEARKYKEFSFDNVEHMFD